MLLPNELGPEIRSAPPSVAAEQSIPEIELALAGEEGDSTSVSNAKVERDAMDGVETMDMALQRCNVHSNAPPRVWGGLNQMQCPRIVNDGIREIMKFSEEPTTP